MTFQSPPGDDAYFAVRQPPVGFWLGASIFSALCCCGPFGIAGIVFAALAMGARGRGDWDEVERHLGRARGFTVAGVVIGAIALILVYALGGFDSGPSSGDGYY